MKKPRKSKAGKVLDFQAAYLKKLYTEDLAHYLDMYATEKHIQEINDPLISMRLSEFKDSIQEEIKQVVNEVSGYVLSVAKQEIEENPMRDPKEILEELMLRENADPSELEEYIDEEFMIHSRLKNDSD